MMTTKELAKEWGVSAGTLANWRSQNRGPKFLRLGRKVVYKTKDIEKFESVSEVNLTRSKPKKSRKGRTAKARSKSSHRR